MLTTALVLFALSQKAHPPERVTKIVFDADELIVDRERPDVDYIVTRRAPRFGNLIKVRENFADKIVQSIDQM